MSELTLLALQNETGLFLFEKKYKKSLNRAIWPSVNTCPPKNKTKHRATDRPGLRHKYLLLKKSLTKSITKYIKKTYVHVWDNLFYHNGCLKMLTSLWRERWAREMWHNSSNLWKYKKCIMWDESGPEFLYMLVLYIMQFDGFLIPLGKIFGLGQSTQWKYLSTCHISCCIQSWQLSMTFRP